MTCEVSSDNDSLEGALVGVKDMTKEIMKQQQQHCMKLFSFPKCWVSKSGPKGCTRHKMEGSSHEGLA